eukprot:TRINITY_DN28285_c0_g2_i1.p1 TRINITY_DN28285_c0_g2~~TRINITY_DN28285_c0_g2_i1.p1  ORF type:complete len:620 (+),score=76.64 TRINITY_DN28285_c0_g2_i1:131-1990(+)
MGNCIGSCFSHGRIEHVEERAMSLNELGWLLETINANCTAEGWNCVKTGEPLLPGNVNLYDLNYYLICPSTAPRGVFLRGLQKGKVAKGQIVKQLGRGPDSIGKVMGSRASKDGTSVLVRLSLGKFRSVVEGGAPIEIDGVPFGVPTEVECPHSLSLKEILSTQPLRPRWFVSHWWGEKVFDFIRCCERHAKLRGLEEGQASYWVCAYANRQHEITQDITYNPADSSFQKAIDLADGVLLVLDPDATPFKRIWCDFELHQVLTGRNGTLLDIATVSDGEARILSDGIVDEEKAWEKKRRELNFPISLLAEGLRIRLEHGTASMEIDKIRILNYITKHSDLDDRRVLDRLADSYHLDKAHYDHVNQLLTSRLALLAWPQAVKHDLVNDFDKFRPGAISLPRTLSGNLQLKEMQLDLQTFDEVTDAELRRVGKGLPPNLEKLELNVGMCNFVTHKGVAHLAEHLPRSLTHLSLRLAKSEMVCDEAVQAIARRIPRTLQEFALSVDNCKAVGDDGFEAVARRLPGTLKVLDLDFSETSISDMSLVALAKWMLPHLQELRLDVYGCLDITEIGMRELAAKIPKSLSRLKINSRGGAVGRSFCVPGDLQEWLDERHASHEDDAS